MLACTARLESTCSTLREICIQELGRLFSRDEPRTSSRGRFALSQVVGNRRKLCSRFHSRTLPQTTKTCPSPQRGTTSEKLSYFSVAFPPSLSSCDGYSRFACFLLLKPCELLPENPSLCTKDGAGLSRAGHVRCRERKMLCLGAARLAARKRWR